MWKNKKEEYFGVGSLLREGPWLGARWLACARPRTFPRETADTSIFFYLVIPNETSWLTALVSINSSNEVCQLP